MFDNSEQLADYLKAEMAERNFTSERSFALFLSVSPRTLGRILSGAKVDPESLQRIADALHLPIENLYRLAGYLPPEEAKPQLLREIEHLLWELPEADQRRILDIVRIEYKHHHATTEQDESEEEQTRRAS